MQLQGRTSVSLGEHRTPEYRDYDIEVRCVKSQINLQSVLMGSSCSVSLQLPVWMLVAHAAIQFSFLAFNLAACQTHQHIWKGQLTLLFQQLSKSHQGLLPIKIFFVICCISASMLLPELCAFQLSNFKSPQFPKQGCTIYHLPNSFLRSNNKSYIEIFEECIKYR